MNFRKNVQSTIDAMQDINQVWTEIEKKLS